MRRRSRPALVLAAFSLSFAVQRPAPVHAGPADVLGVHAICEEGTCIFAVTVRHDDEGWDHYADRFEITTPAGEILGTRVLAHPHVHEQPFTRRLPGVRMPDGMSRVRIRARDNHARSGAELELEVPMDGEAHAGISSQR